jgi:arylsulfatase A-like enzyme
MVLALGMTTSLVAPASAAATPSRPNILFILTDDQNPDTLGCFGGKVLTPTLDRLCREGVKFTRAYTSSSVCTPSRYTCMTGQYASRCATDRFMKAHPPGTPSNVGFNVQVEPGRWNVAQVLRAHGYRTGFVGKWHTGGPVFVPIPSDADLHDPEVAKKLAENQRRLCDYIRQVGFDHAASVYRGNLADHKLDALIYHNMEWVTKGALDFLDQAGDKPFFLHLCTTLQHSPAPNESIGGDPTMTPAGHLPAPLNVQAPRAGIDARLKQAGVAGNMGHATWLDDGIAAVVQRLADLGKLDNTLILFFSDNATLGGKGTCYDGGARTPCFLWGKGRIRGGQVCDKLVQNIDFVPTIFEMAQARARRDENRRIEPDPTGHGSAGEMAGWTVPGNRAYAGCLHAAMEVHLPALSAGDSTEALRRNAGPAGLPHGRLAEPAGDGTETPFRLLGRGPTIRSGGRPRGTGEPDQRSPTRKNG